VANGREQLKYHEIYDYLRERILTGTYGEGSKIPTQRQLADKFGVSRPTVARALHDLETDGILVSRQGAGTFVPQQQYAKTGLLGLITINSPGQIGRMADEISEIVQEKGYGLLWGSKWPEGFDSIINHSEKLCELYRSRGVAGVFFTPLSENPEQALLNKDIVERIYKAGIQIVLLDRDICDYPYRSQFDLVGIDNFNAGLEITRHLLDLGYERIEFVSNPMYASTISARVAGFKHAFAERGLKATNKWVHLVDLLKQEEVEDLMNKTQAQAFVCVNDSVAGELMQYFKRLGIRVPEDIALTGIDDDDQFKGLHTVPITTMRQPFTELSRISGKMMLERIEDPDLPPREVRLSCDLIIRESCGASLRFQTRNAALR